jgi:hypothetical protein
MTRTEAVAGVVAVGAEFFDTSEKVETFLAKPADEQAELLAALALAGKAPPAKSEIWSTLLVALTVLSTIAGDVTGVAGAIAAVKALC